MSAEPAPTPSIRTRGTCVTCGATLSGKYCAACGEKQPGPDDYAFGHFFDGVIEAFTHADGKIFQSLRLLLTQPGRLTAEFIAGRRKPYLKPLALFLVANTVFFLALPLIGWDTLTTPLARHLHNQFYSPLVRAVFERRFPAGRTVPAEFVREFDTHGALLAKSLVIAMVPLFALVLWAVFARARRRYLEHVVFALHFYAFWLFFLVASLGLTTGVVRLLAAGGAKPSDNAIDDVVSLVGLALLTLYLFHAVRTVHGGSRPATLARALVLAVSVGAIMLVYRGFLFLVTYCML